MTAKQLGLLFLCGVIPWTIGNAVMALVPLHAQQLGANDAVTGIYMAVAFAALAAGSLSSGWLARRFRRPKALIIAAAVLSVPTALLMSLAQDIVQLTLANAALWLLFGVATTLVNLLTGLAASEGRRGLTFGIVAAAAAFGRVFGGGAAGPIVDRWDFPTLLVIGSGLYAVMVGIAFMLEEHPLPEAAGEVKQSSTPRASTDRSQNITIWMLLSASVMSFMVIFMAVTGRPLAMEARGFTASEISSVVAISGFFNLPLPFVMGWFSDLVGRRFALMITYALQGIGALLLIPAVGLWQFVLAQALITIAASSLPVGAALITDTVAPSQLSVTLARWSSTIWVGAVLGALSTGMGLQILGTGLTFGTGALLSGTAIVLVLRTLPRKSSLATQITRRVQAATTEL